MEKRLIDANALIEYLKKMWGKWDYDEWYEARAKDALKDDIEIVNEQPTVDAVPWEFLERYAYWFCNQVSFPQFIQDAKAFYRSYVADMDGFADGERGRVK